MPRMTNAVSGAAPSGALRGLSGLASVLVLAVTATAATPEASLALGLARSTRGLLGFRGQQSEALLTTVRVGLRVSHNVSLGLESTLELTSVPTPSYAESSRTVFALASAEFREKGFYWRPGVGLAFLRYAPEAARETAPGLGLVVGHELVRRGRHSLRLEAVGRMRIAGGMELKATLLGVQLGVQW